MMFSDVSTKNDDLATNDADHSLKTPLVQKGLSKLIIPVRKYIRPTPSTSTTGAHLHKNNPARPVQNLEIYNKLQPRQVLLGSSTLMITGSGSRDSI